MLDSGCVDGWSVSSAKRKFLSILSILSALSLAYTLLMGTVSVYKFKTMHYNSDKGMGASPEGSLLHHGSEAG